MKLLFDENLSPRLPELLASIFPGSVHVRNCGLRGASDEDIWRFAQANGFVIISKDADFYYRGVLRGAPPQVIWLRMGNCTSLRLRDLIERRAVEILGLGENPSQSVLVIS